MVESFLSAHRGQIPDPASQKRVDEWTPEVSAVGWARAVTEIPDGNPDRDVILVAEDDAELHGLAGHHEPPIGVLSANRPARAFYEAVGGARSDRASTTKRATCCP